MIELVYSPNWFHGKDIIIDTVSIVVLSLIAFFSIRCYRIDKENKNYLYLAISFIVIAFSFLFSIITNFTIYYKSIETANLGFLTLTYQAMRSTDILFFIGYLMHRILMLSGLFMLYCIYDKHSKSGMFLGLYLILVSTYFSRSAYYIFHLTMLVMLLIITLQYWKNYRKVMNKTSKWLFYGFSLITLSQIVFIFINTNPLLYVAAEIIQLLGYIGLLITFIKVLKDGKKKGKK
ncbi:hypothetical protein J4401_07405 [Candidatus Woesearchaeota archaeon]|nr:hypothetical protein [Candidatus Woesearchaeota archaeon]